MQFVVGLKDRRGDGIGADPVVVTVGADKRAVKSDVARLERGNRRDLRADEIVLFDAVLLVQDRQNVQFDLVGYVLVGKRDPADKQIEFLAGDRGTERFCSRFSPCRRDRPCRRRSLLRFQPTFLLTPFPNPERTEESP